jgi:hypothetical protein
MKQLYHMIPIFLAIAAGHASFRFIKYGTTMWLVLSGILMLVAIVLCRVM